MKPRSYKEKVGRFGYVKMKSFSLRKDTINRVKRQNSLYTHLGLQHCSVILFWAFIPFSPMTMSDLPAPLSSSSIPPHLLVFCFTQKTKVTRCNCSLLPVTGPLNIFELSPIHSTSHLIKWKLSPPDPI